MLHACRVARTQVPPLISVPLPLSFHRKSPSVRIRLARSEAAVRPENPENMDKAQNHNEKTGNVMSHSFGEGYSTRCDEEGFGGGIFGRNQSLPKNNEDKFVHENHPDYDKTQGSEASEKEKARHQSNIT